MPTSSPLQRYGWQHSLRISISRLRRLGTFLEEWSIRVAICRTGAAYQEPSSVNLTSVQGMVTLRVSEPFILIGLSVLA